MQSCTFGRLPPVNLTACVSLLCSFSGAELYSFPGQSFVPMKEHPFCQPAVGAQWAFSSIYSLKSRILRGGFPWGWSTVGHLRPGQWCMTVVDSIACLLTKVFNFLQVSLKEWLAFRKREIFVCLLACLFALCFLLKVKKWNGTGREDFRFCLLRFCISRASWQFLQRSERQERGSLSTGSPETLEQSEELFVFCFWWEEISHWPIGHFRNQVSSLSAFLTILW